MGASALAAMPDLTTALSVAAVGSVIIEFLSLVPFVPGPVPGAGWTRLSAPEPDAGDCIILSRPLIAGPNRGNNPCSAIL
jgi:hypothetical protein